jgi:hypothetical protein
VGLLFVISFLISFLNERIFLAKGKFVLFGEVRGSDKVDLGFSFEWGGYFKEVDLGSRLKEKIFFGFSFLASSCRGRGRLNSFNL